LVKDFNSNKNNCHIQSIVLKIQLIEKSFSTKISLGSFSQNHVNIDKTIFLKHMNLEPLQE